MEKIFYKNDIVEFKNFLSLKECKKIIDCFNQDPSLWKETCFYNSSVIDPGEVVKLDNELTVQYFNELRHSINIKVNEVAQEEMINLSLSGHKWLPGAFAAGHSDNSELDGTPNAWRDNKYASLIYLNKEYQGGQLVFDEHEIKISPAEGSLIVFDPGIKNIHSVSKILSGERYTILSSWNYMKDFSQSEHDRLLEERKRFDNQKEEQRRQWKRGVF